MMTLYTIGHSTHPIEDFIGLLRKHGIAVICDVRSSPYSQYNPQFNREDLIPELKSAGIGYVFLGRELGPRSEDPACYEDGRVSYRRLAETAPFREGLNRLRQGMKRYRVSLLCAEKDPLTCHRTILICRELRAEADIRHILADGGIETQPELETRLLHLHKLDQMELFESRSDQLERAFDARAKKIAYHKPESREEDAGDG
jgi:uncharacterized protein (DUF488 family)